MTTQSTELLQCFNKGCGKKFDPNDNTPEACQFHPGEPVFHDVKKKWSCCKKYSTDFSEFLSIKGCKVGHHSNERPVENPTVQTAVIVQPSQSPQPTPEPLPLNTMAKERPSASETKISLAVQATPALIETLEAANRGYIETCPRVTTSTDENANIESVAVGTICKNSGCKSTYTAPSSNRELCSYHPGVPIFHEGMKFWTCCNRRTSDFESFLQQAGCATGRHYWTKEAARSSNLALSHPMAQTSCRFDHFQLPGFVILTIYAKQAVPSTIKAEANQVSLHISLAHDAGALHFERDFNLYGLIDPAKSVVKLFGTKVEVSLRKAEAMSWPTLELRHFKNTEVTDEGGGDVKT